MFICTGCFVNEEIIGYIESFEEVGECNYCKSEGNVVCDISGVGEFIREGLDRAYEHLDDGTGAMRDSENKIYIGSDGEQAGVSLIEILNEEEQIFSERHDFESIIHIINELIMNSGPSDRDISQGAEDKYGDSNSEIFVIKDDLFGEDYVIEYDVWETFKNECMHVNRFFDLGSEENFRETLLSYLNPIFKNMEINLKTNSILYRSRSIENGFFDNKVSIDWNTELGPAPYKYSGNNRMSPAGISYMYLSDNRDLTLAEIRNDTNCIIYTGVFKTVKDLRLLDLTDEDSFKLKSIFSEEYRHEDRWKAKFIKRFIEEISKPIKESDSVLEYVPTQVLSEFIRKIGFNGIRFKSSKDYIKNNFVFFCGPSEEREYYKLNKNAIANYQEFVQVINVTEENT